MKKAKLILTAIVAATLTACGGTSAEETTTSQTTTEATEQPEDTVAETTIPETIEETTEEETEAAAIAIGAPGTIENWTITIDNVQTLATVPDGYVEFNADDGNKYLLISLTASNEGKEAGRFMPSFGMADDIAAKILYGDGYEFTQTQLLGYSNSIMDSTINPLSSKTGDLAFELPDSVADSTEPLILQISAGSESINFSVR